jgi:hypothetical protein
MSGPSTKSAGYEIMQAALRQHIDAKGAAATMKRASSCASAARSANKRVKAVAAGPPVAADKVGLANTREQKLKDLADGKLKVFADPGSLPMTKNQMGLANYNGGTVLEVFSLHAGYKPRSELMDSIISRNELRKLVDTGYPTGDVGIVIWSVCCLPLSSCVISSCISASVHAAVFLHHVSTQHCLSTTAIMLPLLQMNSVLQFMPHAHPSLHSCY